MMKRLVLLATCLLACPAIASAGTVYQVTFSQQSGAKMLNVDFRQTKPSPELAESVLRSSLDTAVSTDSSTNIVATVFFRDEMIRGASYVSQIVYVAEDDRIVSFSTYMEEY